jgi:hypothetical protein
MPPQNSHTLDDPVQTVRPTNSTVRPASTIPPIGQRAGPWSDDERGQVLAGVDKCGGRRRTGDGVHVDGDGNDEKPVARCRHELAGEEPPKIAYGQRVAHSLLPAGPIRAVSGAYLAIFS